MICASAALVGDWAARNYETTRLLAAIEVSEGQMAKAQDAILAVDIPDDPAPDVAQDIDEQLRETAAAGRRGVAEAGVVAGRISFLPWHADLVSAQAAYLAHNRAWEDYLAAGAEDPQSLFAGGNQIDPTWRRAEFEVREAVPPLPWPGLSDRVEAIFTDEEEPRGPSRDVSA
jgi:hypothetical protein